MKRIETFHVGQKAVIHQRLTQKELDKFVELTGDNNPLHTDRNYAEKTNFKGIVVHGMLGASYISTLVGKHLPGEGALWVSNKIQFLLPVRLDDELEITAEVTAIHVTQSLLNLNVVIQNQDGQKVTVAECQVRVLEPSSEEKPKSAVKTSDKVTVVIGGSSGIGAATARVLAKQGQKVFIVYRSNETAAFNLQREILAEGGACAAIQADVRNPADVERLSRAVLAQHKHITGLVNAAAPRIVERKIEELSWDEVQSQIDGQVKAAFLCIKAFLPHFVEQGSSIVNVGSIVVDQSPPASWIGYVLAKNGVHALTKCLAEPLGPRGIRINTVAPGMTDTGFIAGIPEKARLLAEMQTPLRRIADPNDVAECISFLLADGSRHITGETLRVNGGKTLV